MLIMKKLLSVIMIMGMVSCADRAYVETFDKVVKEFSSESFYGRNNYDNGEKRAADYIVAKFNELCVSDFVVAPKMQSFSYPLNVMRGAMAFAVDGKRYEPTYDFVVKEFSPTFKGTLPVVSGLDVTKYTPEGFADYINNLPDAASSAIVIDYEKFHECLGKPLEDIYLKYFTKIDVGGVIFKYGRRPEFFKARSWFVLNFPTVCVGPDFPEDAKMVDIEIESEMIPKHDSQNVYAWVKGTSDEKDYYVFIAHYDHLGFMGKENLFQGANDNASGTAALLALAEYYSKPQNRPERDILFLWVGGEESNLLGSLHYVHNPIYKLEDIRYLINLDMIGDTAEELYCECSVTGQKGLDMMKDIISNQGYFKNVVQGEMVDNSDHYFFGVEGVPAMYFETKGEYYQYYHTPRDTYDNFTTSSWERLFEVVTAFVKEY